jgi:signal transduction histidine kinase
MRGIAVQIYDSSGVIVYDDATNYRADQVTSAASGGQQVLLSPEGPVVVSPVVADDRQVGIVHVWAYGAGAVLTDRDAQFRSGSLTALTLAALVAIAIASLSGLMYSTRLVRPITAMTETVQAMRGGDRDARTGFQGDDEISVLGKTFDEMADAIEADRQLERRLTADVAHELRTPLQAIQATVEAMQDGVLPADEERLGIVRDETVRLGKLADAILELTRLERGSSAFEMDRIDLAGPVRSAVDAHQALVEAKDLSLDTDLRSGIEVIGDPDRLQQAVGNLLGNAVRYTPAGGSVSVSAYVSNGCAMIEVTDTGVGIAEEDLLHVFSRFWRADDARASSTGGLGIGLAVTKEIVERHRGAVMVERRPEGGTLFRIRLPLA